MRWWRLTVIVPSSMFVALSVLLPRRTVSSFFFASTNTNIIITRRHCRLLLYSTTSRRLATTANNNRSSSVVVDVEISPNNHGTQPLQSLQNKFADDDFDLEFDSPTPIQAHAIPLLLAGYDVMASASTGSGKTFMFSLPLCHALMLKKQRRHQRRSSSNAKKPNALILNPTRELAQQTFTVLQRIMTKNKNLNVQLVTGGDAVARQRQQLKSADIVVGTPGRILQFVNERTSLHLDAVQQVVIDEADRMLDLGFEPQLRRIARVLSQNKKQQTVLCSATFPPAVQRLASEFLKPEYYFVAAGKVGGMHNRIQQTLLWVNSNDDCRSKIVVEQIQQSRQSNNHQNKRIIVFCNTKVECERIGAAVRNNSNNMNRSGAVVRVVTGDKSQAERNKSLADFRSGRATILVATDVAARGLDVPDIGLVIQADAPRDVDTFVHRIGRTGRAGASGQAVALLDGRSLGIASDLVELLREAEQTVPAWLYGMAHVSRSRRLQEEGLIEAGGGALNPPRGKGATAERTSTTTEEFSMQDFRSTAEAGSWGSGRDTSYVSFDEEAYSSFDSVTTCNAVNSASNLIDGSDELDDDTGETATFESAAESIEEERYDFVRSEPSKLLLRAMKDFNGQEMIPEKPNPKLLRELSKRNSNDQRLRFEYIGMFPFDDISNLLKTPERSDLNETHSDGTRLPKVLMVAEKPSIAKAIAEALSGPRGPRERRGISRALPVYTFRTNRFRPVVGDNDSGAGGGNMSVMALVTSVVGHVFSLGFEDEQQQDGKRRQVDPIEYFKMPVVKQEESTTGKLRVVDHLRALAADCDHLVLCLDNDAEGENIAHEVIGVTRAAFEQKVAAERAANPDKDLICRIHRARFSAITKEAIQDSFQNLVVPDAALSRSVDARQELDLRVGVALTRLLSWRCVGIARKNFSPATKFISYGPCQTPTLSFCVDRAREIEKFKAQKYWKINATTRIPGQNADLQLRWKPEAPVQSNARKGTYQSRGGGDEQRYEENATYSEKAAQRIVRLAADATLRVVRIDTFQETIKPPLGLNTVGLLSAASKTMGLSPKQVMNVAEKLYSAGFISYPRTETTRYDPNGFNAQSMLREHLNHPEWGRTAGHLLRTTYANRRHPPSRGKDSGDHPPITVLKAATREEVGHKGSAWRVYEFIARNFIGSLSEDLKYTRTVAHLELNADAESSVNPTFELEQVDVDLVGFAASCIWVLRDIGARKKEDGGPSLRDALRVGTTLKIRDVHSELCATKPPPFLQEHELVELMDKNRIGTDASMATHVNNIVDREYVVLCDETGTPLRPPRPPRPGQKQLPRQKGRYLVPTPLGTNLIELFDDNSQTKDVESVALLSRPAIRAQMEQEVRQIALGALNKEDCLQKNLNWFKAHYEELVESLSKRRLDAFARDLKPTKAGLQYWRKLSAFEPLQPQESTSFKKKGRHDSGSKQRRAPNNRRSQGGARRNKGAHSSRSSIRQ